MHTAPSLMFTFSGKERDAETGYSYFGARFYSADYSIWLSVDPLIDKYPSLSPYVYCANNPLCYIDPTGMIVELTDDAQVNNRINPNHKDYNKAFHDKYKALDADQNAVYSFNRMKPEKLENGVSRYGQVTSNGKNDKGQDLISINYTYNETSLSSKESFLLEETFHATQYMKGDFGFQLQDGAYKAFGVDLHDESAAQIFAAQNVNGIGTVMERALLKSFNSGSIEGVVNFLGTRTGKQGYSGLDKGPISAEAMFKQFYKREPSFNSNGTSAERGIIMRRP